MQGQKNDLSDHTLLQMPRLREVHVHGRGGSGFLKATVMWLQIGGKVILDKMDPDFLNDSSLCITCSLKYVHHRQCQLYSREQGAWGTLLQLQELCLPEKHREPHVLLSTSALTKLDLDRFLGCWATQQGF